jgi:hypothetical protein
MSERCGAGGAAGIAADLDLAGPSTTSTARPRSSSASFFDQPDGQSAIKQAIEEFKVPANQRNRLIAQRRD